MATRQVDDFSLGCCCHCSTDAARRFDDVGVWIIVGFDGADGVSYLFLFSEEEKKTYLGQSIHPSFHSRYIVQN